MNRRNFARRAVSGIAVAAAGTPALAAAASLDTASDWVRDPARHIGAEYLTADGNRLTLVEAKRLEIDARLEQWTLRFASGRELAEGLHVLSSATRESPRVELFLQPRGAAAAVAYTSRLA